jgi:folate-binding protein YgfZ
VYRGEDHLVLVQDPRQPHAIDALLTPYVLSSDVRLDPATVGPICIAPTSSPHAAVDGALWRPGQLAPLVADRGASPVVPAADVLAEPGTAAPAGLELLDERTIDRWRIRAGFARFGPDLDETSFPSEAGLDLPGAGVIEATKGCYLGQESVAKIHNFGHPRRWVQAVRSSAVIETGAPVLADDGAVVGIVTSATSLPEGGSAAIARLDWAARSIALSVADAPLERV